MAKPNPKASFLIDDYIENLPQFSKNISKIIRELIHITDSKIVEDWKWNRPIFNTTKMICGFSAHKNHVSLTFFNGAEMSDQHQLFSSDCSAQNTRTLKFASISDINKNKLLDYFKESFCMKEISIKKVSNKTEIVVPEILQLELKKNELAKLNFENMAYTYRKEYVLYISEAKRESTKLSRLEKVISNLEKNIKMHEQYKC